MIKNPYSLFIIGILYLLQISLIICPIMCMLQNSSPNPSPENLKTPERKSECESESVKKE
jgi:hypothetical protein